MRPGQLSKRPGYGEIDMSANDATNLSPVLDDRTGPIQALLDHQIDLLIQLSGSLTTGRAGAPADEIARLERRTRVQHEILSEWMQLEGALGAEIRRQNSSDISPSSGTRRLDPALVGRLDGRLDGRLERGQRFRDLLLEIRRKCDFEMAVLRRARRTAAALSSLLSVQDPTYTPAEIETAGGFYPATAVTAATKERFMRD